MRTKWIYIVQVDGLAYACSTLKAAKRVFNKTVSEWSTTYRLKRIKDDSDEMKWRIYENSYGGIKRISMRPTELIEE